VLLLCETAKMTTLPELSRRETVVVPLLALAQWRFPSPSNTAPAVAAIGACLAHIRRTGALHAPALFRCVFQAPLLEELAQLVCIEAGLCPVLLVLLVLTDRSYQVHRDGVVLAGVPGVKVTTRESAGGGLALFKAHVAGQSDEALAVAQAVAHTVAQMGL
jgi:hypothetical protein